VYLLLFLTFLDYTDGNGFKTSTMRLGADAIVFTRAVRTRFYIISFTIYFVLKEFMALIKSFELLQ
jgi:hypothetical protein